MSKNVVVAFFTLCLSLNSSLIFSEVQAPELLTQERDWKTVIVNNSESRGVISYTNNDKAGSLGASCEFDGQKYNHVHFVMPSYMPLIYKANDGLSYVDIYLKAGATEFSTSLIAGKTVSGTARLYYPTYQSNGSIIQRLIDARDLEVTYVLANNEKVTERFSLMGYTHNVTTNVNFCEKLNREITLASLANTPENNTPINSSEKNNNQVNKTEFKETRLAAEQGDARAQVKLGIMYASGDGVAQDYVVAHMYFNVAGLSGHKWAIKNRGIVEKKMTPSQIEKARDLAREWMKKHP